MAAKIGIVVMAEDVDPSVHRTSMKTPKLEYTLVAVQGGNIDQAVDVCRSMVQNEGIESFFLCPGFTYEAAAKVKKAVGDKVSVNITKADMQDTMLGIQMLQREGILH